jgi:hypothetical protein
VKILEMGTVLELSLLLGGRRRALNAFKPGGSIDAAGASTRRVERGAEQTYVAYRTQIAWTRSNAQALCGPDVGHIRCIACISL